MVVSGAVQSPDPASRMLILDGQVLREGDEAPKKPRPASAAAVTRPIPERLKKHIEVHSFQKQMTREQWCARPIRI